jgi:hypothetical protein
LNSVQLDIALKILLKVGFDSQDLAKSCYIHSSDPTKLTSCLRFSRLYRARPENKIENFLTVGVFKEIFGNYDEESAVITPDILNNEKLWCNNPINKRECNDRRNGSEKQIKRPPLFINDKLENIQEINGVFHLFNLLKILKANYKDITDDYNSDNNIHHNNTKELILYIVKETPYMIDILKNSPHTNDYYYLERYSRKSKTEPFKKIPSFNNQGSEISIKDMSKSLNKNSEINYLSQLASKQSYHKYCASLCFCFVRAGLCSL